MEDSFTLQLEPINSVKSEKQYQQEIEHLQAENFGLKTENARLRHNPLTSNIEFEKTLLETKKIIENLQNQKLSHENKIRDLQNILNTKESNILENNERNINIRNQNLDLSEENTRLIKHIENLNNKLEILEKENQNSKNNFSKREMEIKREFDLFEMKNKEFSLLKDEVNKLRADNKKFMQNEEKNNALNFQIQEKDSQIYNLEKKVNLLNKEKEVLSNQKKTLENEKKNHAEELRKREDVIESNKKIYIEKMNERIEEIKELRNNKNIKDANLSLKAENALKSMKIPHEINAGNIKIVINALLKKINQLKEKKETLENESKIMQGINNKRSSFLNKEAINAIREISKEFLDARSELTHCQDYLYRKNKEIKELKKENMNLKKIA